MDTAAASAPEPAIPVELEQELAKLDTGRAVILVADGDDRATEVLDMLRRADRLPDVHVVRLPRAPAPAPVIVAPPEHERTKQLISLHHRRQSAKAAIEAHTQGLEAAAAPIAEEIERIEAEMKALKEEAALATSRVSNLDAAIAEIEVAAASYVEEQVAAIAAQRAVVAKLEADLARFKELNAKQVAELRENRGRMSGGEAAADQVLVAVAARLDDARARFDAAMETSRGRRLARELADLDAHIGKIFHRDPGLREAFMRDVQIRAHLERGGIVSRKNAVAEAVASQAFDAAFKAAYDAAKEQGTAPKTDDACLALTMEVLKGLSVDLTDIGTPGSYGGTGEYIKGIGIDSKGRVISVVEQAGPQSATISGYFSSNFSGTFTGYLVAGQVSPIVGGGEIPYRPSASVAYTKAEVVLYVVANTISLGDVGALANVFLERNAGGALSGCSANVTAGMFGAVSLTCNTGSSSASDRYALHFDPSSVDISANLGFTWVVRFYN